jgi:UDP-glucose 4-epimerase
MSDRRAVVTGGAGFVGAALCTRLVRDGWSVSAVDDCRLGDPANWPSDVVGEIGHLKVDIRDGGAVEGLLRSVQPSLVYHLAAVHFIPLCEELPAQAIDVNVAGTQSVLTACARVSPESSIVFTSSGAVYAPSLGPHTEGSLIGPTDVYGHTKMWGEQLLTLHHRKTSAGVGIARLFNVFGPRETNPHFIPAVLNQAKVTDTLQLGNLETRRDYVFTEDVADALSLIGATASAGAMRTFNVGSERALSGADVLDAVGALLGRKLHSAIDSNRVRASDRPLLLSDCAQAHEQLGWSARTSLADGLEAALMQPLAQGVDLTA